MDKLSYPIKAIIGLGNPGLRFMYTRHNIGFRVVDALAQALEGKWRATGNMEFAEVPLGSQTVTLVKPQTFMNSSGEVIPALQKDGIKPENILVVHDELEQPFGKLSLKFGGGHRGHNGIRSIIQHAGPDFARLRVGISRPATKEEVGDYVLAKFSEGNQEVEKVILEATDLITNLF
jgi:peptidyl-tRNA hydrolase, PTH1 family